MNIILTHPMIEQENRYDLIPRRQAGTRPLSNAGAWWVRNGLSGRGNRPTNYLYGSVIWVARKKESWHGDMMDSVSILCATAAFLGLFHTVIGPDHYLPFIVIAKARKWTLFKTMWVTALCGVGHVLSSVVIGFIGIALGLAVANLEYVESVRGDIAAWALIAFGLVYMIWGLRRAYVNRPHTHTHLHTEGESHEHPHTHREEHVHVHAEGDDAKASWKTLTPWVLFTIFVFGPCEPLIPLLMYPAATSSMWGVAAVAGVFSLATIGMMLTIVLLVSAGLTKIRTTVLERFSHALAGGAIFSSGLAITFLGL
jgi:nickel/cobalt exporter